MKQLTNGFLAPGNGALEDGDGCTAGLRCSLLPGTVTRITQNFRIGILNLAHLLVTDIAGSWSIQIYTHEKIHGD